MEIPFWSNECRESACKEAFSETLSRVFKSSAWCVGAINNSTPEIVFAEQGRGVIRNLTDQGKRFCGRTLTKTLIDGNEGWKEKILLLTPTNLGEDYRGTAS